MANTMILKLLLARPMLDKVLDEPDVLSETQSNLQSN